MIYKEVLHDMRPLTILLMVILAVALAYGCSSGGKNNPVVPKNTDNNLSSEIINPLDSIIKPESIPLAEYSDLAENNTKDDPSGILYAGILELDRDNGTITNVMDRDVMFNFNITSFLLSGPCPGGCFRYHLNSIVDEIWDIDLTIENPTTIMPFDVRIIFTALGNKTVVNHDGYTDLYDPSGGPFINPFIAFAKDEFMRVFPMGPGATDTQNLQLHWPTGDPPIINYIVTASLPMNTEEPYIIADFLQIGDFPEDLALTLRHMVLSHHGRYEWGSPRRPKTIEAIALHHLENLSAKVNRFTLLIEQRPHGEEWTKYDRLLRRQLYSGSDKDLSIEEESLQE